MGKVTYTELKAEHANELGKFVNLGLDSNDPQVKGSMTYKFLETLKFIKLPGLMFDMPKIKFLAEIVSHFPLFQKLNLERYACKQDAEPVFKALGNSKSIKAVEGIHFHFHLSKFEANKLKIDLMNGFEDSNKKLHQQYFFTAFKIFNSDNDFHLPPELTGLILEKYDALYSCEVNFNFLNQVY